VGNSTSEKPERTYPFEPFITPKVIDDCGDCKAFVDSWIKHVRRVLPGTCERNKDYDPSASSDDAVLWARHVAEVHGDGHR